MRYQFRYHPYGNWTAHQLGNDGSVVSPTSTQGRLHFVHGHQGLWFDQETGLIYNRGRYLHPTLGRYLSMDPNGQALQVRTLLLKNAQTPAAFTILAARRQYADGANLYLPFGSNPGTHRDPTGLFSYVELLTTTSTQAMMGGMINGLVSKFAGRGFWGGFAEGAASGALGGGFAFAASRAGFLGRILFSEIGESVAENTARAAVNGEDLSDAMVQGLFDGMINLGVGEAINLGISRIGSPLLAALLDRVNASRTFKPFTRDNFRENLAKLWKMKSPPAGYDAHHMLPVKFETEFSEAGINIHHPYFGAWWESSEHRKFKDLYNDAWRDFFDETPMPSIDQILDNARELAAEYGLSVNF